MLKTRKSTLKEAVVLVLPVLALVALALVWNRPGTAGGHEGLYVTKPRWRGYAFASDYVKFYRDGIVVTFFSSGNPKQVSRWVDRKHDNFVKGRYYMDGEKVRFSATSKPSPIQKTDSLEAEGTIQNDGLQLHTLDEDGHKESREYKLAKVP